MFLPPALLDLARSNAERFPWAAQARDRMVRDAAPFLAMDDDHLWGLMFGCTLERSWMVWSNGHCPACQADVPMYNWRSDPLGRPWKLACPHCNELFPKNDFEKFYHSGLDEHGVFSHAKADRSLLFNAEHPDPADPLHKFGVDDGWGYVDGDKRRRFVGFYLIYAQWKNLIVGGISRLAAAYAVTGDQRYAHKAGVLLDRVADLYPTFDFQTQGWCYDTQRSTGYVSVWHDANRETEDLVHAYDTVRPVLREDTTLAAFLSEKAKRLGLANPKATPSDICRNIEEGLLRDPLVHHARIHSNYPRQPIVLMTILRVLGGPENLARADALMDEVLRTATAVDGVTGEKGLDAYSAYVIQSLAEYLARLERAAPGTLRDLIRRYPSLARTYRFHIDTWVDMRYYPHIGDTMAFATDSPSYVGVQLGREIHLEPSMWRLLWELYQTTGDVAYVQALYHANRSKVDGLPYDLFTKDPEAFQKDVAAVIAKHGAVVDVRSIDLKQWHLAILRTGKGEHTRTMFLDYDRVGGHGHPDGLNIGLYAKGLDLMPDAGYPAVQFGGWGSPKGNWNRTTAAHNTVVIDETGQADGWGDSVAGRTTLWAQGEALHAVRATAVAVIRQGFVPGPLELTGPTRENVGLYSFTGASFESVRVYTKPANAGAETPWSLAFSDDFQRSELGPDWRAAEGEWRIENGRLTGVGAAAITRKFPGSQRVEVVASTDVEKPCDLTVLLAAGAAIASNCLFFGWATRMNEIWKLAYRTKELRSGPCTIQRGQKYRIEAEFDRDRVLFRVDGQTIVEFGNDQASIDRHNQELARGMQFERTAALVDISDRDSYVLDVFRVASGHDHAKFQHSHFASMATRGLSLQSVPPDAPGGTFGKDLMMQHFQVDPAPATAWGVDWKIEDRRHPRPPGAASRGDVHLAYTDLTTGAAAWTCEGWVSPSGFSGTEEVWIPRIMVRKTAKDAPGVKAAPLATTFVAVVEPYEGASNLRNSRRVAVVTPGGQSYGDAFVGVEVSLTDGRKDLLLAADVENVLEVEPSLARDAALVQPEWNVSLRGEFAVVRKDAGGRVGRIAMANAEEVIAGDIRVKLRSRADVFEVVFRDGKAKVVAGDPALLVDPL